MTEAEELEDLRRWKRTIESLAGDKTEYVLATINAELRESNAELLAALRGIVEDYAGAYAAVEDEEPTALRIARAALAHQDDADKAARAEGVMEPEDTE